MLKLPSISIALGVMLLFGVSQQTALADDPPLKKITVTIADEPLEIYEGSEFVSVPLKFRDEKDFKSQFIGAIAAYLTTEHASKGYDAQVSTMAGEGFYDASILARILPQPYLKRLAKIEAAKIALFVDPDGRIYFKEILVYDPKTPIYCLGQGRPSVPSNSSIPCLTKKKNSKSNRDRKKIKSII